MSLKAMCRRVVTQLWLVQGAFRVIRDAQSVAALRDALERRGAREGQLGATLDRRMDVILQSMPGTALRCAHSHLSLQTQMLSMVAHQGFGVTVTHALLPVQKCNVFYRMPELGEAASAELEREHHDWVCSIPTQAHVKAVSPGEAPSLALSDAKGMAAVPPAKLAKLRGDLTRVEESLPRSALQESWDADRWRKVMTSLHRGALTDVQQGNASAKCKHRLIA